MPYKSDAQRRYFNANRKRLESEGVDVNEWNDSSRGKRLPHRAEKAAAGLADLISKLTFATPSMRLHGSPFTDGYANIYLSSIDDGVNDAAAEISSPAERNNFLASFARARVEGHSVDGNGGGGVAGAVSPALASMNAEAEKTEDGRTSYIPGIFSRGVGALSGAVPGMYAAELPTVPKPPDSPGLHPSIVGALLGGGAGALTGAVRPGKRSRLKALLLGAGVGAGLGGVAGLGYKKMATGDTSMRTTNDWKPKVSDKRAGDFNALLGSEPHVTPEHASQQSPVHELLRKLLPASKGNLTPMPNVMPKPTNLASQLAGRKVAYAIPEQSLPEDPAARETAIHAGRALSPVLTNAANELEQNRPGWDRELATSSRVTPLPGGIGGGGSKLNPAMLGAILGAGGGAIAGAVRPGKRSRLRSMLMGAAGGGALGGAAGYGVSKLATGPEPFLRYAGGVSQRPAQDPAIVDPKDVGMLNDYSRYLRAVPRTLADAVSNVATSDARQAPDPRMSSTRAGQASVSTSAQADGARAARGSQARLAESLTAGDPAPAPSAAGRNPAMLGALLGAGGGALAGAVRPGKRSRLRAMLMGAAGGGALGGAAGYGLGGRS